MVGLVIIVLILIVAVVLVGWLVATYNFFVSSKARIKASVQEIGNQLKRQAELIPNLEESAKGYLKHEKGIFEKLAEVRRAVVSAIKSGNINTMAEASEKIGSLLPSIQVAVESNPEIKAEKVITRLMEELSDTADKLMYARRSVIDLTQAYNQRLVIFPSNLVAQVFGFKSEAGIATPTTGSHMEVNETETKDVKVGL